MNRNQRATRNNPTNKPFVSGGVISNFSIAAQNPPAAMAPVVAAEPVPASVSFYS